jgi:hypothetical protein
VHCLHVVKRACEKCHATATASTNIAMRAATVLAFLSLLCVTQAAPHPSEVATKLQTHTPSKSMPSPTHKVDASKASAAQKAQEAQITALANSALLKAIVPDAGFGTFDLFHDTVKQFRVHPNQTHIHHMLTENAIGASLHANHRAVASHTLKFMGDDAAFQTLTALHKTVKSTRQELIKQGHNLSNPAS